MLSFSPQGFEGGTDAREFIEEQSLVREINARTVCQTGFNIGLSALAFLCAASEIKVYSFDLGFHEYVDPANEYIIRAFGHDRHHLVLGNSKSTLAMAIRNGGVQPGILCYAVFVDGGHTFESTFRYHAVRKPHKARGADND